MTGSRVILIAEDDEGHVELIERAFERAGLDYPRRHFATGEAILAFLLGQAEESAAPHTEYIVLLDINMPDIDGIEVLRRIKDHPKLRLLPVIMLTTSDDPREIEQCYNLGCSQYLIKPIDYDRLTDALHTLGLFLQNVTLPEFPAC